LKTIQTSIIAGLAFFLSAGISYGAEMDDLDLTIRVVETDDVNEMHNELSLPDMASDTAREHAENEQGHGLDQANDARHQRHDAEDEHAQENEVEHEQENEMDREMNHEMDDEMEARDEREDAVEDNDEGREDRDDMNEERGEASEDEEHEEAHEREDGQEISDGGMSDDGMDAPGAPDDSL
jgi:hypothetical protein